MEALECISPPAPMCPPVPPTRGGSLHRGLIRSAMSPMFVAGFVRATLPMTIKMVCWCILRPQYCVHIPCLLGVVRTPYLLGAHSGTQGYTGVHRGAHRGAHRGTQGCTQGYTQGYTGVHTGVHRGAHRGAHRGTQGYTGVHTGVHRGAHRGTHRGAHRGAHRDTYVYTELSYKWA